MLAFKKIEVITLIFPCQAAFFDGNQFIGYGERILYAYRKDHDGDSSFFEHIDEGDDVSAKVHVRIGKRLYDENHLGTKKMDPVIGKAI